MPISSFLRFALFCWGAGSSLIGLASSLSRAESVQCPTNAPEWGAVRAAAKAAAAGVGKMPATLKIGLCTGSGGGRGAVVCFGVETGRLAPNTVDGKVYEQAIDCAAYPFTGFVPTAWPALQTRLRSEDTDADAELPKIIGNMKLICERNFPGVRCLRGVLKGSGCVERNPGVGRAYAACVKAETARRVAAEPPPVPPEVAIAKTLDTALGEVHEVTSGVLGATAPAPGPSAGPPCPEVAQTSKPVDFVIPECSKIPQIKFPDPEGNASCGHLSRSEYNQLIFLALQGFKAINMKRLVVSSKLSCLLGVRITPEQVGEALVKIAGEICDTSDFPNHRVGCTFDTGESAAWSGDSFSTTEKGPSGGTLMLNPDNFKKQDVTNGGSYQANFVDSIVHEEAHLLADYFHTRVPEATFRPTIPVGCQTVGRLPGAAHFWCDPRHPADPYATPPTGVDFSDAHDARRYPGGEDCGAAYNRSKGKPEDTPLPSGVVNSVDWETICKPSGLYRNEVIARTIADRVVDSPSCRETYPLFFRYGKLREN